MLQAQAITRIHKDTNLFHDCSIRLQPWSIHSIIGPSWSGKSSLLRCMAALDPITSGTLHIDGKIITTEQKPRYPDIYLMHQSSDLRPHMTIEKNILLPIQQLGKYNADTYEVILSTLHITHLKNKYPAQCSGGEQQRASFARALLLQPHYLLLDESTSALDLEHIQIIWKLLQEIKNHTAICLVTHMIHFAQHISDYIHFMDQWTIIESGTDIINFPTTTRLQTFLQSY